MDKGERDLLQLVRMRLGAPIRTVVNDGVSGTWTLGARDADDAACLRISDAEIVMTTDYVRGTGFRLFERGLIGYRHLGRYLAAANLSDVAAMGARAIGLLTILRYDDRMSEDDFVAVLDGVNDVTSANDVPIVGGDIGGATEPVFAATAIGLVRAGKALHRSTAKVGDDVYVTGGIGKAAAALAYGLRLRPEGLKLTAEDEDAVLTAWRNPTARGEFGARLGAATIATSCQDISDGLRATLDDLFRTTNHGADLVESSLPITEGTALVLAHYRGERLRVLCGPSPDFELCFTAHPTARDALCALASETKTPLARIGTVVARSGTTIWRTDGSSIPLPGEGWNQQPLPLLELF